MKLKTAIETMLSDAETSMTSKVEIIQFLRRFSQPKRPITHYSCRGQSTVALKKFLELMGMTGEDFNVVSSSFDPEFNQIRWAQNLTRISELVVNVANATLQRSSFFDELYVKVMNKEDFKSLTSLFCDVTEDGRTTLLPKPLDKGHLAVKIMNLTAHIVKAMRAAFPSLDESTWPAEMRKKGFKNAKIAVTSAMEFLAKNYNLDTGEPLSEDAPYILPLSVLEVYTRCLCDLAGPHGMRENTLVFKTHPMAMDLFRLVRGNEQLMWSACLHAPLDFLWDPTRSVRDENPLRGYFFRSSKAVETADLENKVCVFVGGNAALIHDEGADDNITPAMCVSNHIDFWYYVLSIYSKAYGCQAGLSCQSRIGVPIAMPVWNPKHYPDCSDSTLDEHEENWQEKHPECDGTSPILAEYGLFLGKSIDHSFSDVRSFIEDSVPFKVSIVNDSRKPDFTKAYLTKEELAWEWFAMTHMDEQAGGIKAYAHVYDRKVDDEIALSAMSTFKTFMQHCTNEDMARLSSCAQNNLFAPVGTSEGSVYTALSAFIEGVVIGLRKAWSPDGTSMVPFVKINDGVRSNAHLITNVYSGVFTDMSPMLGSKEDDGSVFPCPLLPHSTNLAEASRDTAKQKEQFTAFLDRMATGKSMEQVKFAKRSPSVPRRHVLILETNLDASKMLDTSLVNLDRLTSIIGTVFLQTLVLNRNDPSCAFDDDSILTSSGYVKARHHDVMLKLSSGFFSKMFPGVSDYRLPSGAYSTRTMSKNLTITARQDKYGRLALILVCSGDMLMYAKLAYRFRCGLPLETASIKEKTFTGFSGNEFAIRESEWGQVQMADTVIQRHMTMRSSDYDGCGSRGSTGANGDAGPLFRGPLAEVPTGYLPSRRWYANHSTFISCGCVVAGY